MIPQSFIQDLLARVDIIDVIERYVPLKKAGANYKACCPFHGEKTPSFTVSQSKQFYHCFGCGANGSALGFVMEYSGLSFPEAVEELARQVGMSVPRESLGAAQLQRKEQTASLADLMGRAARFYRERLKADPRAIDYLKRRGLTGQIAARFGLGYAPDDWQGLKQVFDDYEAAQLAECGLVIDSDSGRRYDRFRDRVMFPILDVRGNVIGFGGRVIDAGEPKYLNSPETPLFEKGRELYGLVQARQAIHAGDQAIVVEGYMDVVALSQYGVDNAVATLGTATTPNHIQKLFRHADEVVFCFDGDAAGRKAAWRALEAGLEQLQDGKRVRFLFLPPEHDPDSFVRAEGAERFRQLAGEAPPLTEVLLRELRSRVDLATAEGRAQLVFEAKPLLARLQAPMVRAQLVRALAQAAALESAELERLCGLAPMAPAPAWRNAPRPTGRPAPRQRPASLVRQLLRVVLAHPGWAARLPFDLLEDGSAEGCLLLALADAVDHGDVAGTRFDEVFEFFRGSEHEALLAELASEQLADGAEEVEPGEREALFEDTLQKLRRQQVSQRRKALTAQIAGGVPDSVQRLELDRLVKKARELDRLLQEKQELVVRASQGADRYNS